MLARWFGGRCLLLFDSTLQSWSPIAALGPLCACSLVCCLHLVVSLVAVCTLGILQPRLELRFCHSPLTDGFQCHVYLPIHCFLFPNSSLQVKIFNTGNAWVKILLQSIFVCEYYDQRTRNVTLSWYCSWTSMFDTEPTSIAAIVTYKKWNQIFSSFFLLLKTIPLVHFFFLSLFPYFLYVTMAAIEVDYVSNIDIQKQDQDNITVMFLWS